MVCIVEESVRVIRFALLYHAHRSSQSFVTSHYGRADEGRKQGGMYSVPCWYGKNPKAYTLGTALGHAAFQIEVATVTL